MLFQVDTNPFIPSNINNRLRSYFENSTTNINSTPWWHYLIYFWNHNFLHSSHIPKIL